MCETHEPTKFRIYWRTIEIIKSKIEPLKMNKLEKSTVGMNFANEPTATKIEANNMSPRGVTSDPIPLAAICAIFPRCCLRIRRLKLITMLRN